MLITPNEIGGNNAISHTTRLRRVEHLDNSYSTPTELEIYFISLPPISLGVIHVQLLRSWGYIF